MFQPLTSQTPLMLNNLQTRNAQGLLVRGYRPETKYKNVQISPTTANLARLSQDDDDDIQLQLMKHQRRNSVIQRLFWQSYSMRPGFEKTNMRNPHVVNTGKSLSLGALLETLAPPKRFHPVPHSQIIKIICSIASFGQELCGLKDSGHESIPAITWGFYSCKAKQCVEENTMVTLLKVENWS